jgi:hypothetical protein
MRTMRKNYEVERQMIVMARDTRYIPYRTDRVRLCLLGLGLHKGRWSYFHIARYTF